MKKSFYILTIFFLHILIGSCTDDALYETQDSGTTSLKIVLNVPVDNGRTRGLIYGPDENPYAEQESTISNARILAFNKDNHRYLGQFVSFTSGENTLIANINIKEVGTNELNIVVLTNLLEQENGNELIKTIESWEKNSITKEQALKALKYSFSQKWDLSTRLIPMWGETNITPIEKQTVTGNVDLYRAVSKINVVINDGKGKQTTDGKDVFKLKSVRVYYARTSGLAGSLHAPVANNEGSNTIITPSIPEDVEYFPRYNDSGISSLLYESDQEGGSYAIENQIYVPESDQQNTEEPMCLIVGGYYMGSSEETFYRVDFKQGNKGSVFYNAIRNHIYNFNITNVTRPGTEEPDPALDHVVVGMDVTIKDWTTEWMRGIGGQYTLEVSTGGFVLAGSAQNNGILKGELEVTTTHNKGWNIENQSGNWFTIEKTSTGVVIKANPNNGGERKGSFIVKSGNLEKEITVRQRGKGTANSYIVSDNGQKMEQDLIVTVKGNGEVGLVADGVPLEEKDPYISADKIGDVQVIWETAKGLITIAQENGKAKFDKESGIIKYKVDLTRTNSDIEASNTLNNQEYKGGNALIGAFGKNSDGSVNYNDLLWSWHIWVCPDIDTTPDGLIDNAELKALDQTWASGYTFMDRNMGALSKDPGLPSLGLLYQWGRKDPFIGAGKVEETPKKMYTHLPLADKGYSWKNSSGSMSVDKATKAPTTLINGTLEGGDYASLWGTASGLDGETNAGNKTIYDPCPFGYRVPNVEAVVFKKAGGSSSVSTNWGENNSFWPCTFGQHSNNYLQVKNKNSYGFWLNYAYSVGNGTIKTYYNDNDQDNTKNLTNEELTWLPLSGVYEGNIDNFAEVSDDNSLLVNSIMWTNSSVTVDGKPRPAALFLHGVEAKASRNGNHLHRLKENSNTLYAKPKHAGALRCVRDVKVNMGEEYAIKVPSQIKLKAEANDIVEEELTSLLDSWEIVDPGAMWFVMTPDAGSTGSKQKITFKSTQKNAGKERSAEIVIRFNDTKGTTKSIRVTQAGLGYTDHTVTSEITLTSAKDNSKDGQIVAIDDTWEIVSGQVDWLSISQMKSESLNNGGTSNVTFRTTEANTSYSARSTTLTVQFGNGDRKTIKVTQKEAYKLIVSKDRMDFNQTSSSWDDWGKQYFNIESNTDWVITKSANWIKISKTKGSGDIKDISVYCSDNDNNWRNKARTGTITIKTKDGSIIKEIKVYQKGDY